MEKMTNATYQLIWAYTIQYVRIVDTTQSEDTEITGPGINVS